MTTPTENLALAVQQELAKRSPARASGQPDLAAIAAQIGEGLHTTAGNQPRQPSTAELSAASKCANAELSAAVARQVANLNARGAPARTP